MKEERINSAAFQKAELQSERLRIFGVLGFFFAFTIVTAIRVFLIRTASGAAPPVWEGLFLVAIVMAFEYWMLRKVKLGLQKETGLPARFWILSTILETTIPAWAIAFLPSHQIEMVYRPLASPALLVFFIFIILSALRLNPRISVLSGAVASLSYLCAALYLGWKPPIPGVPASITQSGVSLNAVTLLAGGVVAAAVTGQIRKHVEAALREAETKRRRQAVQHDLQVARSIQQSLLAQEPRRIVGFDIAGWNQPADDTGGDYYDWETLSDGRVVVSLVSGQGIAPALIVVAGRAYARASFNDSQSLPAALEHINRSLESDLTTSRFATFVAAVCRPGCPAVEVLSAGHGPLFMYSHSEDQFAEMNAQAIPLGILPSFHADPRQVCSLVRVISWSSLPTVSSSGRTIKEKSSVFDECRT
jgi:Stage II sporulation protein E (SpoIIE)